MRVVFDNVRFSVAPGVLGASSVRLEDGGGKIDRRTTNHNKNTIKSIVSE